jgi:hypothetical protein
LGFCMRHEHMTHAASTQLTQKLIPNPSKWGIHGCMHQCPPKMDPRRTRSDQPVFSTWVN